MTVHLFQNEQAACYLVLLGLTIVGCFTDAIPIQVNVTIHSMVIIAIGSIKSLEHMIKQMKKIHIDKIYDTEGIEQMSFSDAWQFPIVAGCSLCGLYFSMEYFGKDAVNVMLLIYIALGGGAGIKAMITSFAGSAFDHMDKHLIIDFKVKMIDLECEMTGFDIICTLLSGICMLIYYQFKSWVFNNILSLIFCIHALQSMFIGNFKNGFMLLTLLFFYDIFFVFGTDVMLTVAKGIDAPIKLKFPKDYSGEKPEFSILGLGDIVIPGIFVSLCLRFDFLKALNIKHLEGLIKREGKGEDVSTMKYLTKTALECSKSYFMAVNFGYLIAIVATIIVMIVYEHGQPALLYLVPGCCFSVIGTAVAKGEFNKMWEFSEDEYITPPETEDEKDEKKDK
jgi:minor histocompatibility antigen H13